MNPQPDNRIFELNPHQIKNLKASMQAMGKHSKKDRALNDLCEKALKASEEGKKFRIVWK